MSEIAVWCLSERGLRHAKRLAETLDIHCFLPRNKQGIEGLPTTSFDRLKPAVKEAFRRYPAHVFIMATGIVVRVIAPLLTSKTVDPAVVVLDEGGQHAISLVSGHLGGANALAEAVAARTGADPVVTTATDMAGLTAFDILARRIGAKVEPKTAIKATATALLNGAPVALVCDREAYDTLRT